MWLENQFSEFSPWLNIKCKCGLKVQSTSHSKPRNLNSSWQVTVSRSQKDLVRKVCPHSVKCYGQMLGNTGFKVRSDKSVKVKPSHYPGNLWEEASLLTFSIGNLKLTSNQQQLKTKQKKASFSIQCDLIFTSFLSFISHLTLLLLFSYPELFPSSFCPYV